MKEYEAMGRSLADLAMAWPCKKCGKPFGDHSQGGWSKPSQPDYLCEDGRKFSEDSLT